MKVKTSELTGAPLAFAVAIARGGCYLDSRSQPWLTPNGPMRQWVAFKPHEDWAQGGPIIERERITLRVSTMLGMDWAALYDVPGEYHAHTREKGPTPLIAAMRCFVTSKLGDEVEIPKEML